MQLVSRSRLFSDYLYVSGTSSTLLQYFEWLADSNINGQVHYVDVGKTLAELSQKMSGSEQPWHSLHCLDVNGATHSCKENGAPKPPPASGPSDELAAKLARRRQAE